MGQILLEWKSSGRQGGGEGVFMKSHKLVKKCFARMLNARFTAKMSFLVLTGDVEND